jgi:TetR/AcrR family transcriptional regulator, regulator of cefoperazone and chloramphenicol sensitivity
MFGQLGFEGASTRNIATLAGVNAPALQYYFDSKEGLFLACVEHMVDRVWEYMSGVIARAERLVVENADVDDLIEAFCDIHAQLTQCMLMSRDNEDIRSFLARIQRGEGPAGGFEFAYTNLSGRISDVTSAIVSRLLGKPPHDEETLVRSAILSGQFVVFYAGCLNTMSQFNSGKSDTGHLALLQRVNREHTRVVLRSVVAGRAQRAQCLSTKRKGG